MRRGGEPPVVLAGRGDHARVLLGGMVVLRGQGGRLAALRAAPACSTPSQANVPTPARQNTTVTAMSARNTRLACRARMRRRRRMRRPSEARSPSMIQSQSITSIPLPRSVPRISTGWATGRAGVRTIPPTSEWSWWMAVRRPFRHRVPVTRRPACRGRSCVW